MYVECFLVFGNINIQCIWCQGDEIGQQGDFEVCFCFKWDGDYCRLYMVLWGEYFISDMQGGGKEFFQVKKDKGVNLLGFVKGMWIVKKGEQLKYDILVGKQQEGGEFIIWDVRVDGLGELGYQYSYEQVDQYNYVFYGLSIVLMYF